MITTTDAIDTTIDTNLIVSQCIERWNSEDQRTAYFSENFDEWLTQIPEEILDTVLILLGKFDYFSQQQINLLLFELREKLESAPDFNKDEAIYTYVPSTKGIENSSIDYLISYKQINELSKYKLALDLKQYADTHPESFDAIKCIVIIDDYCGSGRTFKTFLEKNLNILEGKIVYYVVTYTMDEAASKIEDVANENRIQVHMIYINHNGKAFDDPAFLGKEDLVRSQIKTASRELEIPRDCRLGKYKCEALVSFYNDTPNNTLGIFWSDTSKYFSLFPRENEISEGKRRPTPSGMKKKKMIRNVQNYTSAKRRAEYE